MMCRDPYLTAEEKISMQNEALPEDVSDIPTVQFNAILACIDHIEDNGNAAIFWSGLCPRINHYCHASVLMYPVDL